MTALADTTTLPSQHEISAEIAAIGGARHAGAQPRLDYAPYRSSMLRHPNNPMLLADPHDLELSTPCFGARDVAALDADLTVGHAGEPIGERIAIVGRVTDTRGRPIAGQLVEIWQANAAGRYRHPAHDASNQPLDAHFKGFGRAGTNAGGTFAFDTIKPGAVAPGQAPHVNVIVFARGMPSHAYTRIYFADETANAEDPVLQSVPTDRRATLLAQPVHTPGGTVYRWNIHLQGDEETVFFDA